MKLSVTTPLAIVLEAEDVRHLRAEDETGAFGILPGHADFLTALSLSVVTWRDAKDEEHHIAVSHGILEIRDGNSIVIATPKAVADDDLDRLETEVLAAFRREIEEEKAARSDAQRLYLSAIRQIYRCLHPQPPAGFGGGGLE